MKGYGGAEIAVGESGILASTASSQATVSVPPHAAARSRAHDKFYVGMSVVLLLLVLAGFSRTLYLRAVFDVPAVPGYLLLHGVVLTAWFVGILLQTTLVAARRTDMHRRLGWIGVGLGVATLVLSLAATVMLVFRVDATNPNGLPGVARIFGQTWQP
jgi:hypothetical protein